MLQSRQPKALQPRSVGGPPMQSWHAGKQQRRNLLAQAVIHQDPSLVMQWVVSIHIRSCIGCFCLLDHSFIGVIGRGQLPCALKPALLSSAVMWTMFRQAQKKEAAAHPATKKSKQTLAEAPDSARYANDAMSNMSHISCLSAFAPEPCKLVAKRVLQLTFHLVI